MECFSQFVRCVGSRTCVTTAVTFRHMVVVGAVVQSPLCCNVSSTPGGEARLLGCPCGFHQGF